MSKQEQIESKHRVQPIPVILAGRKAPPNSEASISRSSVRLTVNRSTGQPKDPMPVWAKITKLDPRKIKKGETNTRKTIKVRPAAIFPSRELLSVSKALSEDELKRHTFVLALAGNSHIFLKKNLTNYLNLFRFSKEEKTKIFIYKNSLHYCDSAIEHYKNLRSPTCFCFFSSRNRKNPEHLCKLTLWTSIKALLLNCQSKTKARKYIDQAQQLFNLLPEHKKMPNQLQKLYDQLASSFQSSRTPSTRLKRIYPNSNGQTAPSICIT